MSSLQDKINLFEEDVDLAHEIIHGSSTTVVQTEGGPVRTFAKLLADNQESIDAATAAINPDSNPADDAPDGSEKITGKLNATYVKLTLSKVAQWILSTFAGFTQIVPGAVVRTVTDKLSDDISMADCGIKSDGETDQTAELVAILQAFATAQMRGIVRIAYNTKFTIATVYAVVPVGITLIDESSINTGQPPGYRNKTRRVFTNDIVIDDAATEIASSHHPVLRLNNTHTAGTVGAANSYKSIMFGHGFRWNNDPIDTIQYLTRLSPRGTYWRSSWLLNTKADYAINGATLWQANTVYAAGDKVNTSTGNVYVTAAGGTSGIVEPSHVSGDATDNTVTWTYLGNWVTGSNVFYFDEDGYGAIVGQAFGRFGVESATKRGISMNADEATGDTYIRDDQRGQDIWRRSTDSGLQTRSVLSKYYGGPLNGATPQMLSEFHQVANAAAVSMTNVKLPIDQLRGSLRLYFADANTTLVSPANGGNFILKGGGDLTPAAGNIIDLILEPALSLSWIEVSRNF